MAAVAILVADGFETIECLTILDILRRGGVRASLVSINDTRDVISAQQVSITCDEVFSDVDFDVYDYVVLPGGMPGTTHLRRDERVCDVVREFAATKHVAAICAAPSILAELGLLEGRRATCFPGFDIDFPANIITASAMGQALPFALTVLEDIAGERALEKVCEGIQL